MALTPARRHDGAAIPCHHAAVSNDDDEPSRRQLARKARRDDGDRSARLARALMTMSASALGRLHLDEYLAGEVASSRRITALAARRREERRLAGVLRSIDLDDLTERLAAVERGSEIDRRPIKLAETWRTRLLDGGGADLDALLHEQPSLDRARLTALLADARRERDTGRPPGAARALFRTILTALSTAAEDDDEADANADADASADD